MLSAFAHGWKQNRAGRTGGGNFFGRGSGEPLFVPLPEHSVVVLGRIAFDAVDRSVSVRILARQDEQGLKALRRTTGPDRAGGG